MFIHQFHTQRYEFLKRHQTRVKCTMSLHCHVHDLASSFFEMSLPFSSRISNQAWFWTTGDHRGPWARWLHDSQHICLCVIVLETLSDYGDLNLLVLVHNWWLSPGSLCGKFAMVSIQICTYGIDFDKQDIKRPYSSFQVLQWSLCLHMLDNVFNHWCGVNEMQMMEVWNRWNNMY